LHIAFVVQQSDLKLQRHVQSSDCQILLGFRVASAIKLFR
jgi:hypothetical protein